MVTSPYFLIYDASQSTLQEHLTDALAAEILITLAIPFALITGAIATSDMKVLRTIKRHWAISLSVYVAQIVLVILGMTGWHYVKQIVASAEIRDGDYSIVVGTLNRRDELQGRVGRRYIATYYRVDNFTFSPLDLGDRPVYINGRSLRQGDVVKVEYSVGEGAFGHRILRFFVRVSTE